MINKDCYSLDLGTWPAGKKIKSHDDEKNNYLYILYTNICIKVICINHGIQKRENITQYIYIALLLSHLTRSSSTARPNIFTSTSVTDGSISVGLK